MNTLDIERRIRDDYALTRAAYIHNLRSLIEDAQHELDLMQAGDYRPEGLWRNAADACGQMRFRCSVLFDHYVAEKDDAI